MLVRRFQLGDVEDVGAITLRPGNNCMQWKSRPSQVVRKLLTAAGADGYNR